MTAVDITLHYIQGSDALITEQTSRLQLLMKTIRDDIGMDGHLSGTDILMLASAFDVLRNIPTSDGTFTIRSGPVYTFVENGGVP